MAAIDFKQKWNELSPRMRTTVAIGALFGGLVVMMSAVMSAQAPTAPKQRVEPNETNMLLPKKQDNSVEVLAASNDANKEQINKLKEELDRERSNSAAALRKLEEEQNKKTPDTGVSADMVKEMMAMKARLDDMEKTNRSGPAGKAPGLSDPLVTPTEGSATTGAPVASEEPKLRVVGGNSTASKKESKSAQPPIAYLPPGSMFEVILLNGMDAPTNAVAQKNPVPALVRVKTDALLPNNFSHDIKECFGLVSGFGSLSSERAQLRSETLSCVRENGQVIEAKMDGYVVGEDGRVGVRGRLVSKQGQMIAKALAAGVLSGFGQALAPQQIPQLSLGNNSTIQTQQADLGTIGASGVARGFSDASKAASQFFLEMAREMTPVVEVDAGRKVTIVLIKGLELK